MKAIKERLDVLLVKKGIFPSREKAKAAIMAGIVYVDGQKSDKAGNLINENADIVVKETLCPYVSRGGLKLEKALNLYDFNLKDALCVDIGASTGGFTDCMLQKGARKVFAIDVGYGQLDWKLRNDPRVVNMEKCNIRYLDTSLLDEDVDFISIDVSFISLKLVFPIAAQILSQSGSLVCLVKPQFEAGKEQVGKGGIIKDKEVHRQVIENTVNYGLLSGLFTCGVTFSPVTGAKGNIEYLLYMKKEKTDNHITSEDIFEVVSDSHKELQ